MTRNQQEVMRWPRATMGIRGARIEGGLAQPGSFPLVTRSGSPGRVTYKLTEV